MASLHLVRMIVIDLTEYGPPEEFAHRGQAGDMQARFAALVEGSERIMAAADALGVSRVVTITHRDAAGNIVEAWSGSCGVPRQRETAHA